MTQTPIKNIVIAGGGTAGWIAAAALSRTMGSILNITLVESDAIGTVGVGEATIPTMRNFHKLIGVDEQDFMRATNATFKLGIAFENWGAKGDRYIHAFGEIGKSNWMAHFSHLWLEAQDRGYGGSLDDYCFELKAAEAGKFYTSENSRLNYAYHLDSSRYAKFLRDRFEPLGIRRIEGRITEVHQNPENGHITSLELDSAEKVEGDFFLDCTGFKALLSEKTLGTKCEDWSNFLQMNRALAVQTDKAKEILPYTRTIAHDAGWQWRIPLRHRTGNGLVYSSKHLSDDEAQSRLLSNIEGPLLGDPKLIRFSACRRKKVWEKNCLALGLASGFVEPLESTSIHLIQIAITRLIQLFPFSGVSEKMIKYFNEQTAVEIERIRDFLLLHYAVTSRDDSEFWKECRNIDLPDSLRERIELYKETGYAYQGSQEIFRTDSWVQVMKGQGLNPCGHHPMAKVMGDENLRNIMHGLKTNIANAVSKLPAHEEFLTQYCGPA